VRCSSNETPDGESGANVLDVVLAPGATVDLDRLTRHIFTSSSCGICSKASIDAVRAQFPPIGASPPPRRRMRRRLEKAGLVSSLWDTSQAGPAKRTYTLTAAGQLFLGNWADILQRYQALFEWPQPRTKDNTKQ
jgi:hypothetical protein